MSVLSVVVALYSVLVQLENGEEERAEVQVTPDFLEANNTRSLRDSDLELILARPANYHTFNELPILIQHV